MGQEILIVLQSPEETVVSTGGVGVTFRQVVKEEEDGGSGSGDKREDEDVVSCEDGDGDSAFIRWLTTIHDEIDSTADTLKDEATIVKVRRMMPNLEILTSNESRPENGRVRANVVLGLDDAVAKAIKNLQELRANLKEEAEQRFNLAGSSDDKHDWTMDVANNMFFGATTPRPMSSFAASTTTSSNETEGIIKSSSFHNNKTILCSSSPQSSDRGGTERGSHCGEDATFGESGGESDIIDDTKGNNNRGGVQVTPPSSVPAPEPVAGYSRSADNHDHIAKRQKVDHQVGLDGEECHNTSALALFPQVFPLVLPYLEEHVGDVLVLRQVWKPWKALVDNTLENHSSDAASMRRDKLEPLYHFHSSARISSFLEQFETHFENPFVGRFASFKYDYYTLSSEAIAEYCRLATLLLKRFGTHLKSLHVEILHTNLDNCRSLIQGCLGRVKNLESLSVHYANGGGGGGGPTPVTENKTLPRPHLVNLKSISLTTDASREVLMRLHQTVAKLISNPHSLTHVKTFGVPADLALSYPKLESAEVRLDEMEDYTNLAAAGSSWPLSKLTLSHSPSVPLLHLFKSVEAFKATLTSLQLQRPLYHNRRFKVKLDLPGLKQLTIVEHPSMMLLEFLTNLVNLEVLTILNKRNLFNDDATMQCLIEGVQGEVVRCGLWEVFPKLTKICLTGPKFTRRNRAFVMRRVATRSRTEFQRLANQRCYAESEFD